MGRYHWVTIVDVRGVPADYLGELVEWSYQKALGSLSKVRRNQLIG
jgi:predicted DNA-binding protein (MmcQ/YjbR family)